MPIAWNILSTRPSTMNWGLLPGIGSERASKVQRAELGSTSTCRPMRASSRNGWPSSGRPWKPFTRKTNEFWVTAADGYHRIDIRQTSRHLVVRQGDRIIADTGRPLVLYES